VRGFGEKKFWIVHTVLAITIVIGLVFASGCADVSFGSQKFGDFGTSVDEQKAVNCFIGKYGDPQTNAGPARFLEPVITTGLSNNVPVDTVMKLNKDTPKVNFWVFYDNFAKGDDLELKWTYLVSGKDVMTLHQQAGGDFGRAYAEYVKPDTGWPSGHHKISITGNGTSASVTIEVIDGATVTGTLPCQEGGQAQDGGQKVKPDSGGTPHEITPGPTLVGAVGPTSSCTYTLISQWGSGGAGTGQFIRPQDIAVDSAGNVYVADSGNYRIQKFDATGNYRRTWGSEGWSEGQYSSPQGIAVDSTGNVYVADSGNRIQKFDANGRYLHEWGSRGTGEGQFYGPIGIAVDSAGNVYVVDYGNDRIQKFDANGRYLNKWGSRGTGEGQFSSPQDIAVDSAGNVHVADSGNNRIQKFDSDGNYLFKWGSEGTGEGQFSSPHGIAVDSAGNVYVVDYGNDRIQKFDANGRYLNKWGSRGTGEGQFSDPFGVAVDSAGNVYVADTYNYRIQKFSCLASLSGRSQSLIQRPSQESLTPTPTPPLAVHLENTPTILYVYQTQAKVLTPTLIISLNPTPTPTTVPTTPQVVYKNTTPTTPIPYYKGYSY